MTTKLTWVTLANGDLLCEQYPIRVRKPLVRGEGWEVRVPSEHDDGIWTSVYDGDDLDGITRVWRKAEVPRFVDGRLDQILAQAAGGGTLADLWTGAWDETARQQVIDREIELTARLDAAHDDMLTRIRANRPAAKPSPTPRADLLAMLDAARPYVAHAAEGGGDQEAVVLLAKMRGLVR